MADVMTIREAAARAKAEGMPVSEYTLRRWVNTGAIPVRNAGHKKLLCYSNLVRYLRCEDGCDNAPAPVGEVGIRRIEAVRT